MGQHLKVEEDEAHFLSYWLATVRRRLEPGFRYQPFLNYVHWSDTPSLSSALYNYFHEYSHAQLNNGVLGLTLNTLQKIPAHLEKLLFPVLSGILKAADTSGEQGQRLYRDLFVFGHPLQGWLSSDEARSLIGLQRLNEFHATLHLDPMSHHRRVFRELNYRRRLMYSEWEELHEAFATFNGIMIAVSDEDWYRDIRKTTIVRFAPGFSEKGREALEQELKCLAEERANEYLRVKNPKSIYARGYQAMLPIFNAHEHPAAVHVAALVASHFPYHCCNLLDMPEQEFEQWTVGGGALSPKARFKLIANEPNCLSPAMNALRTRGTLSETEMRPLLEMLLSGITYVPLPGEDSKLFGAWERRYLWDSKLFTGVLGTTATQHFGADGMRLSQRFDEDKSWDFRHGECWNPPIIFPDGRIKGQNPEATRRIFWIITKWKGQNGSSIILKHSSKRIKARSALAVSFLFP